jgi:hypothetical protein
MATSKKHSAERAASPHPLSKAARRIEREQQIDKQPASTERVRVAPETSVPAAAPKAAADANRVSSGISIDGRQFARTQVEVIKSRRQQRGNQ